MKEKRFFKSYMNFKILKIRIISFDYLFSVYFTFYFHYNKSILAHIFFLFFQTGTLGKVIVAVLNVNFRLILR